ncbi:aldolase [Paramesorhizobium deserti]|uniref:Aldolase n=1 Tax=Paramesorhizobium deserti TaxID=1494590 RepID=A0A135HTJ9_9HYPH|nr:3-keto-5-aminohexanoate cleavage protein [Paramesorhizobium deserti]KXF76525.1 aldolase [Paramesorhizobium deserti]
MLLEVALNGNRDHPATPRTPAQIAAEARSAIEAGAQLLHFHPYDAPGRETFDADDCARAIRAVRASCPGIPISLSTSATIEGDPEKRFRQIAAWDEMPDLVTANQGEDGIIELCELLLSRGVGIEAGLLSTEDARLFVASGLAPRCRRVLIESLETDPADALRDAETMERIIVEAGIRLEQVHHGEGVASWAVNRRAVTRGHGIRTGLEDTPVLPDGRQARDNAELIAAAAAIIAQASQGA